MSRRENNLLSNKSFVRELYEHYDGAKRCLGCGELIEKPEWHHIVPVAVGGKDIITNIVPLCHACHSAITFMKPVQEYMREGYEASKECKTMGRKPEIPENSDAILEDYFRCRIPKSIAAERLGKSGHFIESRFYINYKKTHGIVESKNNIDIRMSIHGRIETGEEVGYVKYTDGRVERFGFGNETPLTGDFDHAPGITRKPCESGFIKPPRKKDKRTFKQSILDLEESAKDNPKPDAKDFSDETEWWTEYRKNLSPEKKRGKNIQHLVPF